MAEYIEEPVKIKYDVLLFPTCAIRKDIEFGKCGICKVRGNCSSDLKESIDSKLSKE
jgi:hypothetical protein